MKILHITPWYPSDGDISGIFIREHIESIDPYVDQQVIHLNVIGGKSWNVFQEKSVGLERLIVNLPFKSWKFLEVVHTLLLFWKLLGRVKKFDLINFHIAYPQLRYWSMLSKVFRVPVLCIEHWSIYGQNFGLPRNESTERRLSGVKAMFSDKIHFCTVSQHLANQIQAFSGNNGLSIDVLPNVVNPAFGIGVNKKNGNIQFLMASVWRKGKRPLEVIRAFAEFEQNHQNARLVIAGDGALMPSMQQEVEHLQLKEKVAFLGMIDKTQLAVELGHSSALIHPSDHETFSAICAESLCTGTPIIVSDLPAVKEYLRPDNGIVVSENTTQCWLDAMMTFADQKETYFPSVISAYALGKFSKESVGALYLNLLKNTYEEGV